MFLFCSCVLHRFCLCCMCRLQILSIGSSDSRECFRNSHGSPSAGVTVSFLLSTLLAVFCFPTNFEKVLSLHCYFLVFLASVLEVAVITDLVRVGKHHLQYH